MAASDLPSSAWWERERCPELHPIKGYQLYVIAHPQKEGELYAEVLQCNICGWSKMFVLTEE